MNKLVLKGLISCVFMSQVLAVATDDPDMILKELLGKYADVKPVSTTPVKTKVVRGDIVSPAFKKAILSLRQLQAELDRTKEEAQQLSDEVEIQKTSMKTLQDQVDSLKDESQEKEGRIELLNGSIEKMQRVQELLLQRYQQLADASGSLETATILKMKITEEIENIKTGLLSEEAKSRYPGVEYINYRHTIESVALRLVVSIDTEEKRAAIPGLTDLYTGVFKTLNSTEENKASFELSADSKFTLSGIFKSILEKELEGFAIPSIPAADTKQDNPMKLDLANLAE